MTASLVIPAVRNSLLILLIAGIVAGKIVPEDGASSIEIQTDISDQQLSGAQNENPANRVLPVDAEHKSKITFPQQSLEASCRQILADNLVKFLKRVKKSGNRKGKQDDGDDDGDGEDGIAGVLAGLGEGNGALSALSQLPQIVPQLVSSLTQLSGAVNQGLNGTDTPNLPSFLIKSGQQLIQALTAGQSQRVQPQGVHVQPIPGQTPMRRPRPTPAYEYPPGPQEIEDYGVSEEVKQPLQPTVRPLRPGYEQYPNNPFLENADIRRPGSAALDPNVETINGLPPKTSLWQIYKSFRTRDAAGNGSLTQFQLAHPEAFSNELLQSISQSISNVRGQSPSLPQVPIPSAPIISPSVISSIIPNIQQNLAITPTEKPVLEEPAQPVFQPPRLSIFSKPNRPTLSVYKPGSSISGVGVDINSLALNASFNKVEPAKPAYSSGEQLEEEDKSPSIQQELESAAVSSLGVSQSKPGGSGVASGANGNPAYNLHKNSLATTGSFSQLQAQSQGSNSIINQINQNAAQFVNSPSSSHLTNINGNYMPAVASLHEQEEDSRIVGPQKPAQDITNGFGNKTPYTPIKNVLLQAPRLTPAPAVALKPPSNLQINNQYLSQPQPPPQPDFSIQAPISRPVQSLVFPPESIARPQDPNPNRAPTVSAAISSNFAQYTQNAIATSGVLPPSLLPQNTVSQSQPATSNSVEAVQQEIEGSQPQEEIPVRGKPGSSIASSLTNIAQESISHQPGTVNQAPAQPGNGVPNVGAQSQLTSNLGNVLAHPQIQDHRLLQYILINYPHLLGLNVNPGAIQTQTQVNQASAPAPELTTAIPETTTPLQESIVTSTSGSTGIIGGHISSELENAPESIQGANAPVRTKLKPTSTFPTGVTNKNPVLSPNWVVNGAAPSLKPEVNGDIEKPPKQHYFQNIGLNFGGLIQGALNAPTTPEPEPEKEPQATSTVPSSSGLVTISNFKAPPKVSSAPIKSNPVKVADNKEPEIVENTASKLKPTSASVLSSSSNKGQSFSESLFPSLSHLYGNPPPPPPTTPAPTTTTIHPADVTLPPLNFEQFNGYPEIDALPVSSIYVPPAPQAPIQTSPFIDEGPQFEGPSLGGDIPQHINIPVKDTSSAFQRPPYESNQPSFSQKLTLGNSAIAEMSKLPFFQEDTFRPSALPPYFIGIGNQKEEDSYEQNEVVSTKPISEVFSSAQGISNPSGVEASTEKGSPSVAPEEDSAEQSVPVPNFPPGKPVFWMNMYYPNGYPVLTKVRATTESGRARPRRQRKTTFPPAPVAVPETEYYYDVAGKPKQRKIDLDFA